jgi:hypothetical protein
VEQLAADGKKAADRHAIATALEKEIAGMLEQHRFALLEIGAAGRLLVAGELEEVLPLDDAKLLDAAAPVLANGKVTFDAAKVAARRDAMVERALARDHAAVIVRLAPRTQCCSGLMYGPALRTSMLRARLSRRD